MPEYDNTTLDPDIDFETDVPLLTRQSLTPAIPQSLFDPNAGSKFIEQVHTTPWGESTLNFLSRFVEITDGEDSPISHTFLLRHSSNTPVGRLVKNGWIPIKNLFFLLDEEFKDGSHNYSPIMGTLLSYINQCTNAGFLHFKELELSSDRGERATFVGLNPNKLVTNFVRQLLPKPETYDKWTPTPDEQRFLDKCSEAQSEGVISARELLELISKHNAGISYSGLLRERDDFSFRTKELLEELLNAGVKAKILICVEDELYFLSKIGNLVLESV